MEYLGELFSANGLFLFLGLLLVFIAIRQGGHLFSEYLKIRGNEVDIMKFEAVKEMTEDAARTAVVVVEETLKRETGMSGEDLLQQAITITVETLRGYDVPVPTLLIDSIRSVVEAEYQKMKKEKSE